MKKFSTIFIVILAFALLGRAEKTYSAEKCEHAIKCYERTLLLDNRGAVESGIILVMKVKLLYPEGDFSKVIAIVDSLKENAKDRSTREKAYVALECLNNSDCFGWINSIKMEAADEIIAQMGKLMHLNEKTRLSESVSMLPNYKN